MPLSNGDIVAYHQPNANITYDVRDGEFLFGVVDDATGTDVLWSDGTFSSTITAANSLDQILSVSQPSLIGKVVAMGDGFSPEYQGIVLRTYTRDLNGAGSAVAFALVELLSTGRKIEVRSSLLVPVTGR